MQTIKVETEKGHEIVKRIILSQIQNGQLKPGERLPSVVELSGQLGVGRSTLREALSALKATGWIEVKHGGGTFVSKVLPNEQEGLDPFQQSDNIRELLEVRIWLESGSSAAAAERRSEEDLQKLDSILTQMEEAIASNDRRLSELADVDFHLAIAAASHNELLHNLMISLSSKLGETIGATRQLRFFGDASSANLLHKEHQRIYEAIKEGNSALASELMRTHLLKVQQTLNNSLQS